MRAMASHSTNTASKLSTKMTILVSAGSQTYTPRTVDLPFTVDVNATEMLVTFTHANTLTAWPAGVLIQYEVLWGGVSNGISQTSGGVFHDKSGNPIVGN